MRGNNDKERKAPDSKRTWVHKSDLDPKRIDNFSDMIKKKEEAKKQSQSSSQGSSGDGQGSSRW